MDRIQVRMTWKSEVKYRTASSELEGIHRLKDGDSLRSRGLNLTSNTEAYGPLGGDYFNYRWSCWLFRK